MKKSLLMSVAIVGLVAGGHFASAQSPSGQTPGQKTEQPSGPSGGKMSPGSSSGQRSEQPGGTHQGTVGQREERNQGGMGQREERSQGTTGQREERNQGATGQREERNQGATGQREERNQGATGQREERNQGATGQREERNQGATGQREERDRAGASGRQDNRMGQQPSQNENRMGQSTTTTTNTNVNLTSDQRTKIRETVIRRSDAPRVSRSDINFNLSVGTPVPRSVHVVVLPDEVIQIHPAWRGFLYFLVGDEIVVVEPGSLQIVAVLPA
jgi:hypothetical protein